MLNTTGIVVLALAFALAFVAVRVIVSGREKRNAKRDQEAALKQQSRQVRRAKERRQRR